MEIHIYNLSINVRMCNTYAFKQVKFLKVRYLFLFLFSVDKLQHYSHGL